MLFGGVVERRFERIRVFLNVEDLGDVRQTKWDPLVRPSEAGDGRWTVDAWGPLEGRVFNGDLRVEFRAERLTREAVGDCGIAETSSLEFSALLPGAFGLID